RRPQQTYGPRPWPGQETGPQRQRWTLIFLEYFWLPTLAHRARPGRRPPERRSAAGEPRRRNGTRVVNFSDRSRRTAVHLTALVEEPEHVCCRYRVAAYRPYLERAGHSLELRPRPRRWCEWFRTARELRAADAILVQRRLLQRWQLWLIRRATQRLLFDFDDA